MPRKARQKPSPPPKFKGDHGTGTEAATAGTFMEPVPEDKNGYGRRRRRNVIEEMLRKGKLTQEQFQAAEHIQILSEKIAALASGSPLKEAVDKSPDPSAAVARQCDVMSAWVKVTRAVRDFERPVVERVCIHNTALNSKAANYSILMKRLLSALDRVARMLTMWVSMAEDEWRGFFHKKLDELKGQKFCFVTGPGRSGAIAAVYASHYLGVPFKPHKAGNYERDESVLIVDTVEYTGRTLRRAAKWYQRHNLEPTVAFAVKETKGHYFKMWYEARC